MDIVYEVKRAITPEEFIDVLRRSGLAERRPVDDAACMAEMVQKGNLCLTAWSEERLIGVAS
ncbi:MAG: hypothetical protein AAF492_11445 [Verrucomicrobiota bacterium]